MAASPEDWGKRRWTWETETRNWCVYMAYHPCGEVVVNLLLSAKRLDIIGNTDQRDTRRRNPIQQKVNGGQKKQKRAQDAALPRAL